MIFNIYKKLKEKNLNIIILNKEMPRSRNKQRNTSKIIGIQFSILSPDEI